MNRSSCLALLAVLATLPACSAVADDDAAQNEDDYRVVPTDGETLARLKVLAPSGWTLPVNLNEDATLSYRSGGVQLGGMSRLTAGDGTLLVGTKFDVQLNAGNVKLTKGATTIYTLGSLEAKWDPKALASDFGPKPALSVFYTAPGLAEAQVYGQSRSNAAFWTGAPQKALLAPAGDYRFSWTLPILTDVKKKLADGEKAAPSLSPGDKRATIVVKKPAARELPDAPASQCHLPARTFLVHRRAENDNGRYGEPPSYDQRNTGQPDLPLQPGYLNYANSYDQVQSWAALPMKNDTTVKVFPFAATEGANHYELVVNNVAMPLALKPGDTKTIQLERLDVDDVEITKETGETYTTKGTWELYRQGPNSTWLPITVRQDCSNGAGAAASFPTNSGLDVLPGTYRLVIRYTTGEGAKTQEHTVSVP